MSDTHNKEGDIKQKAKLFRVDSNTGMAFRAVAELMNLDSDHLLEELMTAYVSSVRESIGNVARHYPVFAEQYPFVEELSMSE